MRIQRLDICGFKSFNERGVIGFDDGITGIVGPNGCGKSNVVDAIRWVMGEQSAKHLRGRSMEDVIFAGSETQGPSGMAEVALTLRNDRPSEVPAQYQGFSEITVSRRLYRDGRSEYLINKAACRLLDITELFLGTGVGTRAYSIIEQGRIGLIVNAKPEERRALIEEAAGITKYKARKKLAERKLEYTEQNLLRVADVTGELKRQIATLERQARKAERYRQLKDEIREIELHAAVARWLELQATIGHLGRARADHSGSLEALEAEMRALAEVQTTARAELAEAEARLEALREQGHALALSAQREEQQRVFGEQQRQELAAQNEALAKEIAEVEVQAGELQTERAALLELAAAIDEQLQRDQESLGALEAQLAERTAQDVQLREGLDADRQSLSEVEGRFSTLRVAIAADERRKSELTTRAERVRVELGEVETRLAEIQEQLAAASGKTAEAQQLQLSLSSRREEVEQSLLASRAAFDENEVTRRELRDQLAGSRSRLKTLEELQRNMEGHGRGTRSIMMGGSGDQAGQPAIEGVRGLLAESFKAPQEIESALESYLEHRLEDIIVQDEETALRGAAYLTESAGGRATFWPLGAEAAGSDPAASLADCLGRGADLVQALPGAEAIVQGALGGVYVFRSLDAARAARTGGFKGDAVALTGEVLRAGGALTAGTMEGPGLGQLSRRREIEELNGLVVDLQGKLELAQRRHADLSNRVTSEEATLKVLNHDTQTQEVALVSHQKDTRRLSEQSETLTARREKLREEQQSAVTQLDEVEQALTMARDGFAAAEAEATVKREEVGRKIEAATESGRAVHSANERVVELRVKLSADVQRSSASREQVEHNQRRCDELKSRGETAAQRVQANRVRSEELAAEAERITTQLAELARETAEVQAQLETATEQKSQRAGRLSAADEKLEERREALDEVRAQLSELQLQEREAVLSVQHLSTSIWDRHATDLLQEVHRFHALAAPTPEQQERLEALREQVEKMGEINLTAIREHEDVRQRYEYLSQQKLDLENSIAQLRQAIVQINRTSRERMRETFELVNARFGEVFPRLFKGGKAGLQLLEEGGDVLDAGVEIFAQPPGKRLQSVNLLSGGEKALTAVALIFAIFLIKPTPFCLLDEVDAPLDEGNVGRYSDLIKEIAKVSQFILITHNKRTMQIADTLYGVTMEEPGCSKLVSVDMKQREAANQAA